MAKGFIKDGKFRPTGNKRSSSKHKSVIPTGIPTYNTKVNWDDKRKPYLMWVVVHPEKSDRVKGSETIVLAEHYGQAVDDFITIWNNEKRDDITIGYPQVQGTLDMELK